MGDCNENVAKGGSLAVVFSAGHVRQRRWPVPI